MAKGVLGNDSFQRGAASRDGASGKPGDGAQAANAGNAKSSRQGAAKKSPARPPADGTRGNATGAKAPAVKAGSGKALADHGKAAAKTGGGKASAERMKASATKAGKTPTAKGGNGTASSGHGTAPLTKAGKAPTEGMKAPVAKGGSGTTPARNEPGMKVAHAPPSAEPLKAPAATAGSSAGKARQAPAAHEVAGATTSEAARTPARRRQAKDSHSHASNDGERKSGAASHVPHSPTPTDDDPVLPLREPAAPVSPRRPPPPRNPMLSYEMGRRTEQQREVDHALAEALAAEVAEATAKVAVDEALERRPGQEQDADRLLATELATELAEAAVEEVLEHSPSTQRPERERELAAAVAAQVAEVAAEAAVAQVLERHASPPSPPAEGTDADFEERAANAGEDGGDEGTDDADRYDLEAEAEGGFGPGDDEAEDEDGESTWDTSGMELSVTLSVKDAEAPDASSLEPEVEVPDATRDELPRRGPLSLVPPGGGGDGPREPFFMDQAREPETPRPLAQRAAGMLSLARDIAGQALASEGLGRALGAMSGLMEAVRAGLGTGGGGSVDEYGKDPSLVQRLDPVMEFLYSQYWRVSVQGADHLPRGAAILVANHSGALPYDGLVMSLVITRERPDLREPRWLVEDQVFHAPVLGTLFNRLGAVRACPENALRLLDEQRPLVVFPEGYQALSKPFSERYKLKRFGRGGFVKLALRTGAPIVPVAIVGAEETSPLLGRLPASFLGLPHLPLTPLGPLPLPAKWSVRFGEPIGMEGLHPEAADDLGEVQRLTEKTRESIQGMLQSLLRERRSVFAG